MAPVAGTRFMVIPDYGTCGRNMCYGSTLLWALLPERLLWWYVIMGPVAGTCFKVTPNYGTCDRNMF
jgi:hypothetical protein